MAGINSSDVVQLEDGGKIIKVPDLADKTDHVVFAQYTAEPLSPDKPYFRVKVVQQAKEAVIAVGISQEKDLDAEDLEDDEEENPSKRRKDAVAYFSDDGSIASPARKESKEFVNTFGQGDVVGLCIDYHTQTKSLICVFKNNQLIHRRWLAIKADMLLPTVNLWWGTAELHVEWLSSSPPALSQDDLSDWNMPDTVTANDNVLSLRTSSKNAAIQAPFPLHTSSSQYVEMTIVSMGEEAILGPVIGLTSALFEDSMLPGTMMEAVGYSAVDGTVYLETAKNAIQLGENCKCIAGDTMGCGFIFVDDNIPDPRKPVKVVVYFTKNGSVVQHRSLDQPMGGFYPTIGLASQGCTVRVNTQVSTPPSLDIKEWRTEAKKLSFDFRELGSSYRPHGPKHEEGTTQGNYRFSDLLEAPSGGDDVIRLRERATRGQLIQLLQTMSPEQPYFTLTITEEDPDSLVVIGISRKDQSVHEMPGSIVDSVGYSSKGDILNGVDYFEGEKFTKGDEIGCFIEYFSDQVKIVQFVKNSQLVGLAPLTGGSSDLFPSVGFRGEPCAVKVSWPQTRPISPSTFTSSNLSNWMKSLGLCLHDSRLSVQKKKRKLRAMCMKSPQPLSQGWSYFEVSVSSSSLPATSCAFTKAPVVGLTNDMGRKPFKKLVRDQGSRDIRYYCHSNSIGYKDVLSHEMLAQNRYLQNGDRLGFGIVYPATKNQPGDRAQQVVVVYCTHNGSVLYHRAMEQPAGGFYPIISLYKFGSKVDIHLNCSPPPLSDFDRWMEDVEELKKLIAQAKKDATGDHKQTAEERRARPASPIDQTHNHLTKYKLFIYCDHARYNEATHIQARLETKGFSTVLPPESALNSSLSDNLTASIRTCDALVCCMGPEISSSQHVLGVLDLARESGRPILPCILSHVEWPPNGPSQEHFRMLTLDKIEMTEDFNWGIEQIAEKTLHLKGKGYNGKVIKVELGEAAEMLYTDAQKGNKTTNKASDPDALKRAVADADYRKGTSLGNTTPNSAPTHQERPRSTSPTHQTNRASSATAPRAKSAGGRSPGSSAAVQKSKTCMIL